MTSFIDNETPIKKVLSHHDQRWLHLVMSDEYNTDDRDFGVGKDNIFEAIEKPDYTNQAMQYYNSSKSYVTTKDGSLVLITRPVKTTFVQPNMDSGRPETVTKNYTSGMVQSWNKFCFTGGALEMSIDLPGHVHSGGLWAAAWLMGQLSRATFEETTMNVWPWSYNRCSKNDKLDHLDTKQKISACEGDPGYGFHPFQGRGAPEIDIFEIMPGHEMPDISAPREKGEPMKYITVEPFMSTSLQISPGIPKGIQRPINGGMLNTSQGQKWYSGLEVPNPKSSYNYGFWGQECGPEYDPTWEQIHKYMEDAISLNTDLEATHFESHHVYRLEWEPGVDGYLEWYLDDELIFGIPGSSLQELTGSHIPDEPMYVILNTAISHRWGMPEPCDISTCSVCWICYDCTNPECQCTLPDGMKDCKNLPAEMSIDYIRLYQDVSKGSKHSIGCSPESHPTKEYIDANYALFKNWEPYKVSARLSGWKIGSEGVMSLLHIVGAFGLFVIFVFGVYRLCQVMYRRSFPYESLSSLNDQQQISRAMSGSSKFITVENDDMIALVTVSHKATTPREKVLGVSNKSPGGSYQNSSGNMQDIGFSLRRSRGLE